MNDPDERQRRQQEALAVGRLMLAEEDYQLPQALYRVYLNFREHFLRQYHLMDTTPDSTDPETARRWRAAKAHARALADHLEACWATEIVRANEQRNLTLQPAPAGNVVAATTRPSEPGPHDRRAAAAEIAAQDQLERAAHHYAINDLHATQGNITQTLHNLEQHIRDLLRDQDNEYAVAAAHAHEIAQQVNGRWASMITSKYERIRLHRSPLTQKQSDV